MAWKVELSNTAEKELAKLGKEEARRIVTFLYERVSKAENPRLTGAPLKGPLEQYWKYRVGNYRLICDIRDEKITVLVLRVGHRREVYR
jgi:mRNA interferase RelE/StbE